LLFGIILPLLLMRKEGPITPDQKAVALVAPTILPSFEELLTNEQCAIQLTKERENVLFEDKT
jgi:hypothetical protein